MRHRYFRPVHVERAETLATDATLRNIAQAYRRGRIAIHDAIAALREAGCCEPEIAEVLA